MFELFSPQRNSHLFYFVNSHCDCGSVNEEAERRRGSAQQSESSLCCGSGYGCGLL